MIIDNYFYLFDVWDLAAFYSFGLVLVRAYFEFSHQCFSLSSSGMIARIFCLWNLSEMHLSRQTIESLVAERSVSTDDRVIGCGEICVNRRSSPWLRRDLSQQTIESLVAESIRFLSSPCSNAPLLTSSTSESHSDCSIGCVAMRKVLIELSCRLCCRDEEIAEESSFLPLLNCSFVFVVIVIISTSSYVPSAADFILRGPTYVCLFVVTFVVDERRNIVVVDHQRWHSRQRYKGPAKPWDHLLASNCMIARRQLKHRGDFAANARRLLKCQMSLNLLHTI